MDDKNFRSFNFRERLLTRENYQPGHTVTSLVARPRPAFRRFRTASDGKLGGAWELYGNCNCVRSLFHSIFHSTVPFHIPVHTAIRNTPNEFCDCMFVPDNEFVIACLCQTTNFVIACLSQTRVKPGHIHVLLVEL